LLPGETAKKEEVVFSEADLALEGPQKNVGAAKARKFAQQNPAAVASILRTMMYGGKAPSGAD
jgi:flagellar biosynthesis/type III secretory pathway M-ring protein FliF/YscJ